MHNKDYLYLKDILESIIAIEDYIADIDFSEFERNRKTHSATIRELEIIGEAASKLSDELKSSYTKVQWRDIKDLRNLLIHEYFGVDLEIIWNIVTTDIPILKSVIDAILDNKQKSNEE